MSMFCIPLIGLYGALLARGWEMGLGVVARNGRGTCLGWLSRRLDRRGTGEVAKALAAWEAILLAGHYQRRLRYANQQTLAVYRDLCFIGSVADSKFQA